MKPHKHAPHIQIALDSLGLYASLYQPTFLFRKNGRKLPNVPEEGDPWQCFLRPMGTFGVVAQGIGDTPDEAVSDALYNRPGLHPAIVRLGREIDRLTETIRCR